jgi:hypothetical protein
LTDVRNREGGKGFWTRIFRFPLAVLNQSVQIIVPSGATCSREAKRPCAEKAPFLPRLSKWIDRTPGLWDNPTMTVTADAKRRVVVPGVKPGDIFACEQQDGNRFMLVKLTVALPAKKKTRNEILRAIKQSKMSPAMNWEKLRVLTREL